MKNRDGTRDGLHIALLFYFSSSSTKALATSDSFGVHGYIGFVLMLFFVYYCKTPDGNDTTKEDADVE
jgi:hypothetical protein